MLQCIAIPQDAQRAAGTCFYANHRCLIGEESIFLASPEAECLAQAIGYEMWHPKMQGAGYESGCIGRGIQFAAQPSVHEIGHSLSRCCLALVALKPALTFQPLLEVKHRLSGNVFWPYLNHHTAVAPPPVTVRGAHAVYYNLFRATGSWYDEATRTHAEAIYTTTVHLPNHTVFGRRQPFPASLPAVILYLVY